MLLAVTGQLTCRNLLSAHTLRESSDLAANFLQTFGGMYGVIVAFTIYVVWQEHNETQVTIEREASAAIALFRLLNELTFWPSRDEVRALLLEYVHAVPLVAVDHRMTGTKAERQLLDKALTAFLRYVPGDGHNARLYDAALGQFEQLSQAREHRTTIAALRLPDGLRWFVFIGGAITVATLWLTYIEAVVVQACFTAAMTWVVVASATIVIDLDDPYTGDFVVDWQRFRDAEEHMRGLPCPELVVGAREDVRG